MTTEQQSDASPLPANPRYKWFVAGSLMVVYTLNQLDRQILTILLEPIKQDLNISDTQLGLLSGLAFALLYTLLGLPIARLVDRGFNRVKIVSVSIFVWSLMTVFCGMASSFVQLLLARVGVGIGEAGATPASHSLLTDYFDEHERSRGMSLYSLGIPVGGFLGLLLGGILNQWYGWKMAFIIVGIPGLLMAALLPLLVREPRVAQKELAPTAGVDFTSAIRELYRTKTFVHACLATSFFTFTAYATATWGPSYLIRTFGVETGILGITLAFSSLIAGVGGVLLGGWLGDKFGPRDSRWLLWIPAIALLFSIPFALGSLIVPRWWLSALMFMVPIAAMSVYTGPVYGLIQTIMPPHLRAMGSATFLLTTNLIGLGCGPLAVGALSDFLSTIVGADSLRYSLAASVIFTVWGAIHFLIAATHVREELAVARTKTAAGDC